METTETLEITTPKSAKTIYFGMLSIYVLIITTFLMISVLDYTSYSSKVEYLLDAHISYFAFVYFFIVFLFPFLIYNFFKTIREKVEIPEEYKTLRFFLDLFVPIANIKLSFQITQTTLKTLEIKGFALWLLPTVVSLFLLLFQFSFLQVISEGDIEKIMGRGNEVIKIISEVIMNGFYILTLYLSYLSYRFIKSFE